MLSIRYQRKYKKKINMINLDTSQYTSDTYLGSIGALLEHGGSDLLRKGEGVCRARWKGERLHIFARDHGRQLGSLGAPWKKKARCEAQPHKQLGIGSGGGGGGQQHENKFR
jgi:hypothetical protein